MPSSLSLVLTVRGRQRSAERRPGSVVLPQVGFRTELSLTWRKKTKAVVHHETIRTSGQLQNSCLKGQESPPPATPYTQPHPHTPPTHPQSIHWPAPLIFLRKSSFLHLLPPPPFSASLSHRGGGGNQVTTRPGPLIGPRIPLHRSSGVF